MSAYHVGERVRVTANLSTRDREGEVLTVPYGDNWVEVMLDGDAVTKAYAPGEIQRVRGVS